MAVPPRELSITYNGLTFGGSSARQITEYSIHEEEYTRGHFEFEFVTSAATEAAFATEIIAVRNAFRTPRQDLVVTQGSATLLSRKHSDNTGLNTTPTITKDGDPADTGRSRHFRARVDYELPADNVSTNFRRWSTVNVNYDASRVRIVTIAGTYTANSSDGTTGSYSQYGAQIAAYATTVLSGIDASATWEKIEEPQVTRDETDKITEFSVSYREIIHNQATGVVNDAAIIRPSIVITRERMTPGDSAGISIRFGSSSQGLTAPGVGGDTVAEIGIINPGGGTNVAPQRPTILTVTYTASIDQDQTTNIPAKWTSTIKPFLISEARSVAGTGVILVEERPNFGDLYLNQFSATMVFHSYTSTILSQRIEVSDSTSYGKRLAGVWSGDPFDYYEFPGPAVRLKTIVEKREEVTAETDASKYVNKLIILRPVPMGTGEDSKWVVMSRRPLAAILKKGLVGATTANVADVTIETVMQYRNKKAPSIANAGGVTGGTTT